MCLSQPISVLPYGMLLTTIFRAYNRDLDSEIDIRMSKSSDVIDNSCITRLGYEPHGNEWVEKAIGALVVELDSDEEAKMDIPPPSPTHAPLPPPPTASAGSFAAPPDWYQNLSQHLDTMSLNVQQLRQDHQDDIRILFEKQDRRFRTLSEEQDRRLCTLVEEQDHRFREIMAQQADLAQFMRSQFPPPLQ